VSLSFWSPENESYAVNYLMNNGGLTLYGAAGLVSRWANVESAQGPTAVNPYSGAFGIGQWLGARLNKIRGNTDFDAQLAFVVQELGGTEARAGNVLRSANDADSGATGASMYERAEGYSSVSGRDNYTSRTAEGIPQVLVNVQGASNGAPVAIDQVPISSDALPLPTLDTGETLNLTPFLLIGGGLLLYLVLK
jgi:hypothetical protein